jgi:lysylphosphatidylglycerol synthetase-like protein (DUF2156 family)
MTAETSKPEKTRRRMPLPGLAAIALYMMLLAGINLAGVVRGDIRAIYLIFSAAFITASLGLLMMFRWAWGMTLAAITLMTGLFFWKFSSGHESSNLVQALLNLVFFLYLIRAEVREKLI